MEVCGCSSFAANKLLSIHSTVESAIAAWFDGTPAPTNLTSPQTCKPPPSAFPSTGGPDEPQKPAAVQIKLRPPQEAPALSSPARIPCDVDGSPLVMCMPPPL